MITYHLEKEVSQFKKLPFRKQECSSWIKNLVSNHGKKVGDIAFIFCNDEKILEINRQWLSHDYFTDVITFDYTDERVSGDIFISVDTVFRNASDYNASEWRELHRVMAHGVLHLLGFDDQTEEQREQMRLKEDEALYSMFLK